MDTLVALGFPSLGPILTPGSPSCSQTVNIIYPAIRQRPALTRIHAPQVAWICGFGNQLVDHELHTEAFVQLSGDSRQGTVGGLVSMARRSVKADNEA